MATDGLIRRVKSLKWVEMQQLTNTNRHYACISQFQYHQFCAHSYMNTQLSAHQTLSQSLIEFLR